MADIGFPESLSFHCISLPLPLYTINYSEIYGRLVVVMGLNFKVCVLTLYYSNKWLLLYIQAGAEYTVIIFSLKIFTFLVAKLLAVFLRDLPAQLTLKLLQGLFWNH